MKNHKILCLEGDGIGPEITRATLQVLDATKPVLARPLEFTHADVGFSSLDKCGTTITDEVIDLARQSDGVILGPVSHNEYPSVDAGGLNPSGVLRKALDLHANIRPAMTWANLPSKARTPFDLLIVRENLEGFYADRNMHQGIGEFMPEPGVAMSLRKITRAGSLKVARTAFSCVEALGLKKVTAVHKANVMRMTDGLFLECVREVAADYPCITYDEMLVDAAAAHLVRDASQFEVIVTTNMFGDILSDLASELSGSLGIAGSLNEGSDYLMAQAQHGSAPDIAGQNKANPISLILSTEMMLRKLGEEQASDVIRHSIARALSTPETRTTDLEGHLGTQEFTDHLVTTIEQALS